jgi:uncharacterized lipoprotein YddW (UPF0748 family)
MTCPKRFPLLILPLLAASILVARPSGPYVQREVRAVWVTTTAGLDWPQSQNKEEQISSLRRIVADLHNARFNTIYFQVRARGDTYYRSRFEPWAENLTGTLGADPGWDPLALLLQEAHACGMEVHAWFNVFKIRGSSPVPQTKPPHPSRVFPQWTIKVEDEGWLDPGVPAVREYLVSVALDLVDHYDVDGINFDFLRYPGRGFPDDASYRSYGSGGNRGAWRRANVTNFLTAFVARAREHHPQLKIGCSPLGQPEELPWNGLPTAFSQDALSWLHDGLVDYAAPQIYWNLGESWKDPDFASLAKAWQAAAGGRQIVAGIGAYKPEVQQQIPAQIDAARAAGNAGVSFFRLQNIRALNMFAGRFDRPAFVPPMAWRDSLPPTAPVYLHSTELATNVLLLEWSPAAPTNDSARSYAVYRAATVPEAKSPPTLLAFLPAPQTSFVDSIRNPSSLTFTYAVSAIDRMCNESPATVAYSAPMKEAIDLRRKVQYVTSLSTTLSGPLDRPALAAYALGHVSPVRLEIFQPRPGAADTLLATLVEGEQDAGIYVVGLQQFAFNRGVYLLKLRAGETVVDQPLLIR